MTTITLSREAGVVIVTRTDSEGQQTVTGHDLCAAPGEAEGLALARLFVAAQPILTAAQDYIAHLQAVGIPNDDLPFVDALIAAIAQTADQPGSGSGE